MYKTITVKIVSILPRGTEYDEYEFPKLSEYLNDGWKITDVHSATTSVNTGFIFLTFILQK